MIFKNYCIVILGKTDGALIEITGICEDKPRVLNSSGILIATFISTASANEIEDYFTGLERSFFLFEVGADNTGYSIKNEKVHKGLFSGMELDIDALIKKSNDLLENFNKDTGKGHMMSGDTEDIPTIMKKKIKKIVKPDVNYYKNLNDKEREMVINEILDKGFDKLSEYDEKVLELLTKKE